MFKSGRGLPIVFGFAMALTGCGGDKVGDSGPIDTGSESGGGGAVAGDLLIAEVNATCTGSDWRYSAEVLNGWTGDATVNAWEVLNGAAGYDEEHSLASYDYDPDGTWDKIERVLGTGEYVPDSSTLFACGIHDLGATPFNEAMVFAYRIYDTDGNLADCVMIGSRAGDVLGDHGDVTSYNTVSNPSELDDCTAWDE
jgi:hypothetical protein